MNVGGPGDEEETWRAQRRVAWLKLHFLVYIVASILAFTVNAWTDITTPWFLLVLVGWGAPLAVHVAYAMGLLDHLFRR